MKVFIVLALCAAAVLALPAAVDVSLNEEWRSYKATYNKVYGPTEELARRFIWEKNVRYIQKHNSEADAGKHTFWLGTNPFADMTNQEFRRAMNGYKYDAEAAANKEAITFLEPNYIALPDTVDWRKEGYVTPVKNQGECGSCWSFSATGSLEGQNFKKTGTLTSLSEQNLVDCSRSFGNMGCDGGLMDQAFSYIKANNGIDTEASYPYRGIDGKCAFNPANVGATDTGFVDIQSKNETALQVAVATVGPISVAIDASHISFQLYRRGVYHEILCSQTRLDHGVLAVGYGTDNNEAYWLVKNSWGTLWGNEGYIMMSRNKNNECGIATASSYPTV